MHHVVGGRATLPEKQAASTSEVGRFETQTLSTKSNLTALMDLFGEWIDKAYRYHPLKQLILDLDNSVSETNVMQEGTAYNGHFECTCYHPLFLFNQFGDLERAMLQRGDHASAKFWRRVLLPVIERYRHSNIPKFFRGDAAFANPALYRLLEKEGYHYAIRIKANAVLEREIEHLLTRPIGRPFFCKPRRFRHGGAACYNRDSLSLDRFQAHPKWKISVYSPWCVQVRLRQFRQALGDYGGNQMSH